MKRLNLLIATLSLCGCPSAGTGTGASAAPVSANIGASGEDKDLSGNWIETSKENQDGIPLSVFELYLKSTGQNLSGRYCYVTRYGAKIDCDPETNKIFGVIDKSSGIAAVEFSSSFSAVDGHATIQKKHGRLLWNLTEAPSGGEFYGPLSAQLEKNTSDPGDEDPEPGSFPLKNQSSFNCKNASSSTEHAICASQELSALDRRLSAAYASKTRLSSGDSLLRQQQRAWIKRRDACPAGAGQNQCLEMVYRDRIEELERLP